MNPHVAILDPQREWPSIPKSLRRSAYDALPSSDITSPFLSGARLLVILLPAPGSHSASELSPHAARLGHRERRWGRNGGSKSLDLDVLEGKIW